MFDLKNLEQQEKPCKGLVFRCHTNIYFSNGKYVEQTSFNLLKRRSCADCDTCTWMLEELDDYACMDGVRHDKAKDGALYKLVMEETHRDFETGRVEDFDFIFRKLEEQG